MAATVWNTLRSWRLRAILLLIVAASGLASPTLAAPPLTAFSRMPAIERAVISPDGARIALLGGTPDERIIYIAPVDGQGSVTVKLGQAWVRDVRWAGNAYLIVNLSALDKKGTLSARTQYAYQLNRNIVLNLKGDVVAYLLDGSRWSGFAISQPVLGIVDGARTEAIVQGLDLSKDVFGYKPDSMIRPKGDDLIAALWRVDVSNGNGAIVELGSRLTQGWDLDRDGSPRLRWDYDSDFDATTYLIRSRGKEGWTRLDLGSRGGSKVNVLGYSDPDDSVYLMSSEDGVAQLSRRSLIDGATSSIALDRATAAFDLRWDPHRIAPVVVVTQTDRFSYQWLDPDLGAVQAKLSRAFAGRNVSLTGWTKDRSRIIVRVSAPDSPPAWFLFDTGTNQASALGESYPELAGAALGRSDWVTYKARDGLDISAYLTLPPGLVPGARPPLIVLPHGGPAARDDFDFDWWLQALVTRGYAVLQPQFRGSSGFGDAFERAGHREWGGKMQQDLIDGVQAMADRGLIDRARVGIVGASYGGYAALYGATVYPGAYRCAVSVNGVSDLALLIGSKSRAYGRDAALVNSLRTMMGDPRVNAEAFRVASPVFRVTGQTAPILLIHGAEDTTVPLQQSQTMQRALRLAGRSADLVVLANDDHYLSSTAARTQMLESTVAFLDRCLPVTP